MSSKDQTLIKEALKTSKLIPFGRGGGGCINEGAGYETDNGPVFIKKNRKDKARLMFDGEYASLEAIYETKTVRVPKPVAVSKRAFYLKHFRSLNLMLKRFLET